MICRYIIIVSIYMVSMWFILNTCRLIPYRCTCTSSLQNIGFALSVDDFPFRLFGGARALWRVCTGRDVLDFFKTHLQDVALNDDWRSPLQKRSMIKFSVPVGAVSLSQTYFMIFFFESWSKLLFKGDLKIHVFGDSPRRGAFCRLRKIQSTQRALEKRQLSSSGYVAVFREHFGDSSKMPL